ncbi:MAG: hypothetical protein KDH93_13395 [Rhodoferax sp.]|nr:hypothetical protein [Anaerolineae bacterium]MCB2006007.1 hypothetical protein [Rhodoferax sp.]
MTDPEKAAAEVLEDCADRYFAGEHMQLFMAVIYCHQFQVAPPDWVRDEMQAATYRYGTGEAKDLNEAFDIHRKKGTRIPTLQAKHRPDHLGTPLITRVYEAVRKAEKMQPVDSQLFDAVAEQFPGISAGTVKNYYYEVVGKIQQDSGDF